MPISRILEKFPKKRKPLPEAYVKLYDQMYESNRKGRDIASSFALFLERWMHRMHQNYVEFPILEIGAGTLNHIPFESKTGEYDVVEPLPMLYFNSENKDRINEFYKSIDCIPLDKKYARIISVAVLEHVENLPDLIARSALLLSTNGKMLSGIPSEGGVLWYLAWRCGTGIAFWLRHKLSYVPFMRYEHINNADEIISLMRYFFKNVEVVRYPISVKHLSLYTFLVASEPNIDLAKRYLTSHD